MRAIASGTSRRVGDRGERLFGSAGNSSLLGEKPQASPGPPADDRDSVNSARPTRTRFYSARNPSAAMTIGRSGDCAEVNPTAASPGFGDGGRPPRFRPNCEAKPRSSEVRPREIFQPFSRCRRSDFRRHGEGVPRVRRKRPLTRHAHQRSDAPWAHPRPGYP
jgi:hypothetical protein